jgi:hypothetical protein
MLFEVRVTFYPLERAHFSYLVRWLNMPHVQVVWGGPTRWTLADVAQKYSSHVDGYLEEKGERKPIFAYIYAISGVLAGFIQCYDARHFAREGYELSDVVDLAQHQNLGAIDFYLGETVLLGNGWGAVVVQEFLSQFVFKKFHTCFVDPDLANIYGQETLKKAGFVALDYAEDSYIVPMIARSKAGGLFDL